MSDCARCERLERAGEKLRRHALKLCDPSDNDCLAAIDEWSDALAAPEPGPEKCADCEEFEPVGLRSDESCDGTGHYMCPQCAHFNPDDKEVTP